MTKLKKVTRKTTPQSDHWRLFLDFCSDHARANHWFRGVSDSSHKLIPKIGRPHQEITWGWSETRLENKRVINLGQRERRVFNAFRRRARLGLQFIPTTDFEWMALAQHHGVPTRLLDWTANPLMAAWFAVNCAAESDEQVARIYVATVSPKDTVDENIADPFEKNIKTPVFVTPPHWHARIRAQRGCFSIHPEPHKAFEPRSLQHFDIQRAHWSEFRKRLYYFGIDASTVMADLSGLGEALAWQYENEIGIGQVGY
jgi:hypothetical protein